MNLKKNLKIILLIILTLKLTKHYSQVKDIDYVNYNYKYLDNSYKIKIDLLNFNNGISKFSFYKDRIKKYTDSLAVVLMIELNDWNEANRAQLQITYTWERVGYYIWQESDEVQLLAKKYKITKPYLLQKKITNPDDDLKILELLEILRDKLNTKFKSDSICKMNNSQMLSFSFRNNPKVILLKKSILQKAKERRLKKAD